MPVSSGLRAYPFMTHFSLTAITKSSMPERYAVPTTYLSNRMETKSNRRHSHEVLPHCRYVKLAQAIGNEAIQTAEGVSTAQGNGWTIHDTLKEFLGFLREPGESRQGLHHTCGLGGSPEQNKVFRIRRTAQRFAKLRLSHTSYPSPLLPTPLPFSSLCPQSPLVSFFSHR